VRSKGCARCCQDLGLDPEASCREAAIATGIAHDQSFDPADTSAPEDSRKIKAPPSKHCRDFVCFTDKEG
jgi:hypothetical protein